MYKCAYLLCAYIQCDNENKAIIGKAATFLIG